MILLILSVIALLLLILVFNLAIKEKINDSKFIGATVISLVTIFVAVAFIIVGYTEKPDLDRKQELEVLLVNDYNANTILKAQEYNKSVDKYNDYWCRFSIEDRSDYYIDIDSFLEKKVD